MGLARGTRGKRVGIAICNPCREYGKKRYAKTPPNTEAPRHMPGGFSHLLRDGARALE